MPSNQVQLEYDQIDQTSTQLRNAVTQINPQLLGLKNSVDTLLTNGLFFQQTSPAMQHAYSQFTLQLQKVVDNIDDFAKQFDNIKLQIQDMDSKMAAQIKKA